MSGDAEGRAQAADHAVSRDMAGRVRERRAHLGLSQTKLAQQMGVERNTLWLIETGRTKNPRADIIIALAETLQVSTDYLLGLTDDPRPRHQRPASASRA